MTIESIFSLAVGETIPEPLGPCPFCGGPPVPIAVNGIGGGAVAPGALDNPEGHYVSAHVFCHECGAQAQEHSNWAYGDDDINDLLACAVASWNVRNNRNGDLYEAGEADQLNVWPRPRISPALPQD